MNFYPTSMDLKAVVALIEQMAALHHYRMAERDSEIEYLRGRIDKLSLELQEARK